MFHIVMRTLRGGAVHGKTAAIAAAALAAYGVLGLASAPALADSAPPPGEPATVTADSLPTWQINGVVWSSVTVGNTVYATGSFTQARPPGVAVGGAGTVTRNNLLAYDITTGNLITSFNHSLNAQGLRIAASPDGSRVYVGGDFTTVDGISRNHVAAFDTATGALDANFKPSVNNQVDALAVSTANMVYLGGAFTYVNGIARTRLAAVSASGTLSTTWRPTADDNTVYAMVVAPDQSRVVVGGKFDTLNGVPGTNSLGAVDAVTGAIEPWAFDPYAPENQSSTFSYVTDLQTDGTYVYASNDGEGWHWFDGRFAVDPDTGGLVWQDTCYGASYSVFPANGVLYSVGHAHDCSSLNGWPQTDPWVWKRAMAETTAVTGTDPTDTCANCTTSNYGKPTPKLLDWFPTVNTGTYTGQYQGGWTISGNSRYVTQGGEFTTVNGKAQQGLARFVVSSMAPNKVGPQGTANLTPRAVSLSSGTVRLSWQTAWDQDNGTLTYNVFRYGVSSPVYTTKVDSRFWNQPVVGFVDSGLTPGATYKYFVQVVDPFGNSVNSGTVSVTVSTAATTTSQYAKDVAHDGAIDYWRLDQNAGAATSYDYVGFSDLAVNSGVTGGASGAILNDSDTASSFDGSTGLAATQSPIPGPNVFSEEAWFNTTTTNGGKIVGFGNANTGNSSNYDRHIYMNPDGSLTFGVWNNGAYTVSTGPGYNDGQWHQVVGTMSSSGLTFYVDGRRIGTNSGTSVAQPYDGYWRIGGDSPWSGAPYFAGTIDDVAIYPTVLSLTQVRGHYNDSGRTLAGSTPPADQYGSTIWNDSPDVYYRLDETSGPVATDLSGNINNGTYNGSETYGVQSPVSGSAGTAVTFNGSGDFLASGIAVQGPTVYSEELWFKTTTTQGGKLIGFGNNRTGTSSNYDRHVYMETDGQLTFGVWTGQMNTVTSPRSYNDGKWHYMVASQGPAGMQLWLDNQLVGSGSQTDQQAYTGYWRIGGDTTWNGTTWFNGTIDEVAVYPTVLSASQIAAHYQASSAVNHAPTASFTDSVSDLQVNVDGSGSTDSDGSVVSYAWDFGDGTQATGATASHTYAQPGTYQITLTVTDDGGLTGSTTKSVDLLAPNVPPTAAFTDSASGLKLSADGSSSSDSDGSIVSYAWNFGDGGTATGVTADHTYAAGGTYTVTLTVTDNRGGTDTATHTVTVTAPPNNPPTADFTVSKSYLGVSVDGGLSSDSDGSVVSYAWDFGDGGTATGAKAQHVYAAAGTYQIKLTVTDDGGATGSKTSSVTVVANVPPTASFTSSASGLTASVDASASSDSDGSISSYGWQFGDGGTASGVTATHNYVSAGTYTITLTVTDDQGATTTKTGSVTVSGPTVLASDDFGRTVVNGLGTADAGGAWTLSGSSTNFAVSGGSAKITLKTAGSGPSAYLNAISSTATDTEVSMTTDKAPTGTNGIDLSVAGRRVGTTDYNAKVRLLPNGSVRLGIYRTDASATQTAVVPEAVVAGLTYTPGKVLTVRLWVSGTSPTTLEAKVWDAAGTEPAGWQATATDATAALQAAGSVGLKPYLTSSATNAPVVVTYTRFRSWDANTE